MFGRSRADALEAALERERGASDRWRSDWERRCDELARAKRLLTRFAIANVHTDAEGRRFIYADGLPLDEALDLVRPRP